MAEGKAKTWPAKYAHNWMDHATQMRQVRSASTTVKVLDPADCPGMVYFLPTPKSPHGVDVDPTGEYIVAGGKLATVIPVHSFSKMLKAIDDKEFDGECDGIPVLKYEAVIAGEVQNPGLGPLHTEFDGKGNAYTSMFISSEIVKWRLKDLRGGGPDPGLLLDRPPDDSRRRHAEAVGQVRDRAQQDHQGPLSADRARS